MTRGYRALAIAALAGSLVVALALRAPRPEPRAAAPAPASRPDAAVALAVSDGAIVPARTATPKGAEVTVTLTNRDRVVRTVTLLGYEDRVSATRLEPGAAARVTFVADRPGDDFAWLVDGRPAGTFDVTGSHLVEGHR